MKPPPRHRVVQAALEHWWLLTDPVRPDLTTAADQIEMYLASSGYRIQPNTRQEQQMTLGELIASLEPLDQSHVATHGFTNPHSYRGNYMDLAFEPATNITIADMLNHARTALGATFHGYKGGDYVMDEHTDCWLAHQGHLGETLGPLLLSLMITAPQPGEDQQPTEPTLEDRLHTEPTLEDRLHTAETALRHVREAVAIDQPAAPAAFPQVQGRCPACHRASLFLGSGGYVTCAILECPEPDAATTLLEQQGPTTPDAATVHATEIEPCAQKAVALPHPPHKFMRGAHLYQCPGHDTPAAATELGTTHTSAKQPGDPLDTTTPDGLRAQYTEALTAEHYRRAQAHIVASPEEHSAAMADAVLAVRDHAMQQLRHRAEQAEVLQRIAHDTSNKSKTERARAVRRAEDAEAELARLHEGEEPGWNEHTEPTPGQWIWRWNHITPAQRLDAANRIIDYTQKASECFVMNHAPRLEKDHETRATLQRVRDVHHTWQDRYTHPQTYQDLYAPPQARQLLNDLTDALNQPTPAATQATEPPAICDAYQPPTTAADSGLCARCGMFDYRHQEPTP